MTLPSPLELSLLSGSLLLGAGLVFYFLKSVQMAAYLAAAGLVVGLCASVAYGYESMGEAKVQVKLDAANVLLDKAATESAAFKQQAWAAQLAASKAFDAKVKSLTQVAATLRSEIDAQADEIRNSPVPADVGRVLGAAITSVNAGSAAVGDAVTNAATAATVPAGTTVGAWEDWSGTVIVLYGQCVAQVGGLQRYIADLVAASPKSE